MKTKKLIAVLMSTLMVASLAGCAQGGTEEGKGSDDEITIRVASVYVEGHSMNKVFEDVLANFEKEHENVKITREFMPGEQLKAKIKTDAASNNMPDIFPVYETLENLESIKAGVYEDLSDELDANAEWKAGFNETNLASFQYEEYPGQWALPVTINGLGFYYNKEVFEDAGAEVPTTWSELLDTIDKLKSAGYTPWELGAKEAWRCEHLFSNIYYKMYGSDKAKGLTDGTLKYDDPSILAVYDKLLELVDAGAFNPNMAGIDYATESANFASGKVGMEFNGSWGIGETDGENTPDTIKGKVGFFPFPTIEGYEEFAGEWFGGVNDAFGMRSGLEGDKKELVIELLQDITSPETAKRIGEETGNIPCVKTELDQEKSGELMRQVVESIDAAEKMAGDFYSFEPSTAAVTEFGNVTQAVMTKQLTPEEACKQMVEFKEQSGN